MLQAIWTYKGMAERQNNFSIPTDVKMSTPLISDVSDDCDHSEMEGVVKLEDNEDQLPNSQFIYKNWWRERWRPH